MGEATARAAASQRTGPRRLRNHQAPASVSMSPNTATASTARLERPPTRSRTTAAKAATSASLASHRAEPVTVIGDVA